MTKQVWDVVRSATTVTQQIQSMQYSTGRRTQFDSWSPGYLTFTIKNDNGQANNYDLNDRIILTAVGSGWYQWFYVQEILYNDLGGDGNGSTATIICTDLLGRLGRVQVFEKSLASAGTLAQIDTAFNSLMPTGTAIVINGNGDSTAAADSSYTGTALNRLNLNMTTEQGWLTLIENGLVLVSRTTLADLAPPVVTFARQTTVLDVYQMGYSDIKRIALGSNYLNNCTVTPPVAAAQNETDTAGVAAYGTYGAEFATVDNTGSQALSFAQWQVYSRSDPDQLSFQITVSDTANDLVWLFNTIGSSEAIVSVKYRNPGDATTYTSTQIIQGWSMTITPSKTDMEIFTSPLTYTNFFTLDSATFGVLDTSRLGW
jgi:hypothetical protein